MNVAYEEEFEKFKYKMMTSVKDYYGDYYEVSVKEIMKLNGVVLHGLNIMEKTMNICPTIYLEEYFKRYNSGDNFADLFTEIIGIYEEHKDPHFHAAEFFMDYEKIKNKLSVKLISATMNRQLLLDVPHALVEDLALVCMVDLKSDAGDNGSVLIHNNHICMWGIKQEQLIDDAITNAQENNSVYARKLNDVILDLYGTGYENIPEWMDKADIEELGKDPGNLYVLTNRKQMYGASVIMYPGVLSSIANVLGGDYYIIPSSIHEVIILPADISGENNNINSMIRCVNTEMLAREEILSEHAYLYSSESGKLLSVLDAIDE